MIRNKSSVPYILYHKPAEMSIDVLAKFPRRFVRFRMAQRGDLREIIGKFPIRLEADLDKILAVTKY